MAERFRLAFAFGVTSLQDMLEQLALYLGDTSWPALTGVLSPVPLKPTPSKPPPITNAGDLLDAAATHLKKPDDLRLEFADGSEITVAFNGKTANGVMYVPLGDPTLRMVTFVEGLFTDGRLVKAKLEGANNTNSKCVPTVPLAGVQERLVMTSDAAIAAVYDDADGFLRGWRVTRKDDRVLALRCLEEIEKRDVFLATKDHQWQMARAAKAGQTKYYDPVVTDDLRDWFEKGTAQLSESGTNDGVTELACQTLDEKTHLPGFEIYRVRELAKTGTIKVVFEDRATAEREKRPLLDVGARVFYMDAPNNRDVELTS